MLTDTLQGINGCDSIVSLTLTCYAGLSIDEPVEHSMAEIRVYPNPTTSLVNIESTGLSRVELYDLEGRRLQDYTTRDDQHIMIDLSSYASGSYYLRIHNVDGVTIQKLIKK